MCDDESGASGDGVHTLAEELIQIFIRMHTSTHCHSIYSLTLGKQINCEINKFS